MENQSGTLEYLNKRYVIQSKENKGLIQVFYEAVRYFMENHEIAKSLAVGLSVKTTKDKDIEDILYSTNTPMFTSVLFQKSCIITKW